MPTTAMPIDIAQAIIDDALDAIEREANKKEPQAELKLGPKQHQCPKCGTFTEQVLVANDTRLPGMYCNKDGCGWTGTLTVKVGKLSEITHLISPSMIELLRIAPLNETARAQVLSVMLQPVPKSCVTFDQIKDWIETVELKEVVGRYKYYDLATPRPPRPRIAFSHEVEYSYTETGRARYTQDRSGSGEFQISLTDISDMASDCSDFAELVSLVRETLISDAQDNPPDTDGGDREYHSEESAGSEDDEYSVNKPALESRLTEWMQANLPDALAELAPF